MDRVANLGQVFTPPLIVDRMLKLRVNHGTALDPSVGDGAFFNKLGNRATGLEVDSSLIKIPGVIYKDFFEYYPKTLFDTIIGNPPYVRFQDIPSTTKQLLNLDLFDRRSNLYLFFIEKCIDLLGENGELIFITPRDFIKSTSSRKLNRKLFSHGAFTHFSDLGDQRIFCGFAPNCAIWRWQKGKSQGVLSDGKIARCVNGCISFSICGGTRIGDVFEVKVGAVSGADDVFISEKGRQFVCSHTERTGKTRGMIYNQLHKDLYPHRQRLKARKLRKFDEGNWWKWGREFCDRPNQKRIYVNAKTRNPKPFFTHECTAYDGSVLALFPFEETDIKKMVRKLNSVNWEDAGFKCDGRFLFTQSSLENAMVDL